MAQKTKNDDDFSPTLKGFVFGVLFVVGMSVLFQLAVSSQGPSLMEKAACENRSQIYIGQAQEDDVLGGYTLTDIYFDCKTNKEVNVFNSTYRVMFGKVIYKNVAP